MMRPQIKFRLIGILLIALLLSACGGDDETPDPAAAVPGQAVVTGLQVTVLESFPVQVQAVVSGNSSDSCTTVPEISVQQQALTFLLEPKPVYTDTGACDPTPLPFSRTVSLPVENQPAGTYTVISGGFSQSFTLAVDNVAQQPPAADPQAVVTNGITANVNTAVPGAPITISGLGFPANGSVQIGFGLQDNPPSQVSDIVADANGAFSTQINLPQNALPGENWVFSALLNGVAVTTGPILIVPPGDQTTTTTPPTTTTEPEANTVTNRQISKTNLYFIAIGDNGQNGQPVGCGDSIVPVTIDIEPTVAPMTAAYNQLFTIKDQNFGNYYNALYQSNLTLTGINIVNREAIVNLSGSIVLAGTCDSPRLLAQLEQVALQYDSVGKVTIYLDGRILTQRTEPGGRG